MEGRGATDAEAPRILLVDGELRARQLLSDALSREGLLCEMCRSGEEALEALDRGPFDAVIAELALPGVSGLALVEEGRRVAFFAYDRAVPGSVPIVASEYGLTVGESHATGAIFHALPAELVERFERVGWRGGQRAPRSKDETHGARTREV